MPPPPEEEGSRAAGSVAPPGYQASPSGYAGGPVPPGAYAPPAPAAVPMGNYELASWGSRFAAFLVDNVAIYFGCLLVFGGVLAGLGALVSSGLAVGLGLFGVFIGFLVSYGLQPYWMANHNGQTIGKQALGIRTIRVDGSPTTVGWSVLRQIVVMYLLFGIVGGAFVIPWLLDYLWPLWDEENRALHDMLVGSRVVKA
ncbi:MAG: RDD family protein [Solirubrobacteraceae bacterium]|nr:RDD family protein [Solirubrobacteraceae bacterium]